MKVRQNTVRDWLKSGRLKGHKIGRVWRLTEEAIKEFVEKEAGNLEPPGMRVIVSTDEGLENAYISWDPEEEKENKERRDPDGKTKRGGRGNDI